MADYKGLNIRFRGDTTDAAKALHTLSSEARAAQGNLQGIQNALKNTATNSEAMSGALKKFQLEQLGKQAEAARGRVSVLGQSMVDLQKNLAGAQTKLNENKAVLASMPEKYSELARVASSAFEQVAAAQAKLDDAKERVSFAGTNSSWAQAVRDQSEAQAELNAAMAAGDEAFTKRAAQYGTVEGAINAAEEAERKYSAALDNTKQNLLTSASAAQAYENQQRMMAAAAEASQTNLGKFGANATEAGNSLNSMGDSLTSVGNALSSVGDKMSIVSGIAAITFGRNIVSSTEEFGNAISQLGGYLDIGGEQLKVMSEDALKWGKDTQFSATEAANAMNELAKGGMTQAQIQGGAMKATMELAAAGSLDMAQAASVAVQAIKTFGLDAADASQVADALAGAANKSTAEVTELANGFKYVGGWASMAGWNINDVSGALALLSDHGLQSEMAGTALRNVMQRLAAPTNTAAKLMNAYGFSVRDANGQMVSATEVVQRLNDTFGSLGDEEKQNVLNDIFGARALPAAIALMEEGSAKLQEYIDSTTEVGYAGEMAKNRMGDLGWALEMLRGEAETAAVNFGQALAPTIIEVAHAIEDALTWFNSLSDAEKEFIAKTALMAVAVGPVISIVGHMTSGIGSLVSGVGGLVSTIGTGASTIANFSKLMADGGDATKLFAEAAAMATTPMAGTVEGMTQVAEKAATMTTALSTAGAALKGGIVMAGVALMVEQVKSLIDEIALVDDATRGLNDLVRETDVSYASYSQSVADAVSNTTTMAHALNTANESLRQSADYNRTVADTLSEMDDNISSVQQYAATMKELSSLGNLNASQQEQLKQAVEGYNKATGAAVSITNTQRGELNLMVGDIDRVTEAYVRQAKTQAYTELLNEAIKEQARAEKDMKKATEETQAAFFNGGNVLMTYAKNLTGIGQIMNIVDYGKAALSIKGVSEASAEAAYDVDYFRKAAEEAGMTSEQYDQILKDLGISTGEAGDAAQQAGDETAEAAQQAAHATQDAVKAIKKANDAIVRERQREYDHEYKDLQRALDAEYKARQKDYDREYKAAQKGYDAEYKAAQKSYDAEYKSAQKQFDREYKERQKSYDSAYKAQQKQFDREYKVQQKAFDNEYKALQKQLDKEYKAKQKSYDNDYKQRQKELDRQYDAYKKQLDGEESALKKSLDAKSAAYKKQLDSELATLKKANDERLKQQKKADEEETKAFKAETDKRVAALQAEYKERLKALELQYGGSDIDAQIKSLKDQTKAEQDEIKRRGENEKKAELEKKVEQAKTRRARADAEKELNDYLAEIAQEQREKERDAQIEQLEERKATLKDELAAKKDALKEEYDARIESLKEQREAELEVTKEANDAEYETLKEQLDGIYDARKEANDAKLEQLKEANQAEMDSMKEQHSALLESMKGQHSLQLEQLKEQQSEQLESIKKGQQDQLDNLKEYQQAELESIKGSQQAKLDSLKEYQQYQLDTLKGSQQEQLDSMKETQQAELDALKGSQQEQLDAMKGAQQDELDALKGSHQAQLDALKESQQDQLQALKDALDEQTNTINKNGQSVSDAMGKVGSDAKDKFAKGIEPMPTDTGKTAKETLNQYLAGINDMPWKTENLANTTGHSLVERLNAHVMPTTDASKALRNAALREIEGLPNEGRQKGEGFGSGLSGGIGGKEGEVSGSSDKLKNAAENPLMDLAEKAGGFGSKAGNDYAGGIGQGGDLARSNAQSVSNDVSDALQRPADNSGNWGYDFMRNFNNSMVSFWNNTLLPNLNNIGQSIANIFGHSTPKEGPLKGDDQWFYHMAQNFDSGLKRGIPELIGTVGGLAQSIEDGMDVSPDLDVVGNLIANMRAEETALARQSRRMGDIVTKNFDPYASANYNVGYDVKPMVQTFASGVTEALRSGVPQQAGVTIVIQKASFANDMDVDRFSERVTARIAAAGRRGW